MVSELLQSIANGLERGPAWLSILLDASVKATVLLTAAAVTHRLLRRSPASARHAVWVAAVAGALVLPVLSAVLPTWRLEILPIAAAPAALVPVVAVTALPELGPDVHPPRRAPARLTPQRAVTARSAPEELVVLPPLAPEPTAVTLAAPVAATSAPSFTLPFSWPVGLAMLWVLGAMVFLTRILAGRIGVWRMARTATPVSRHGWLALTRRLCKQLGISRPVLLVESEDVALPMTWGFREPVVLLPTSAETWSTDRLELVLLHELAHVRRLDALTQLVAQLTCAFYWFHPLAWLAERRMRALREYACDDQVLAAGNRPSEYAGQILDIVRSMGRRDPHTSATLAMARKSSQLEGRLMAILDPQLPRRALGRLGTGAVSLGFLALVLPLAMFQPAAVAQTASERGPLPRLTQEESERRRQELPTAPAPTPVPPTGEAPAAAAAPEARTAPVQGGSLCRPDGRSTTNISVNDGVRVFSARREDRDCMLEVQAEGEVALGRRHDPIELSRGGSFVATERNGKRVRKYEARASNSGRLTQRWTVDGQERSVGGEARVFVDEMLSQLGPVGMRAPVARAPEAPRAPMAAANPGVPPLAPAPPPAPMASVPPGPAPLPAPYLAPAPPLPPDPPSEGWNVRWSDDAPEEYREKLQQAKAEERAARDALALLERAVGSDSRLAEGLEEVAGEYRLAGESTRQTYLDLADKLRSDDLRGDVLKKLMGAAPISLETGRRILQVASGIRSDEALGEVLDYTHRIKEHELVHGPLSLEYLQAASQLRSDEALADALTNLLHPHAPREAALQAMKLARRISSDEQLHKVLIEIKDHQPLDNEMVEAYRSAAGSIDSERVRAGALEDLEEARRSGSGRMRIVFNNGGDAAQEKWVRELERTAEREARKVEKWAEKFEREAERAAAIAEREAEKAAAIAEREAERAAAHAEREAERFRRDAERAGRDAERLAQIQSRQVAQTEMERFREESRQMEQQARRLKQETKRLANELKAKAHQLKQRLSQGLEDSNLEEQLDAEIERLESVLEE